MYITCCYHLLATLGEKSSDDDIRVCVESADDVDSQRSAVGGVRVTKKQPIFLPTFSLHRGTNCELRIGNVFSVF